MPIEAKEWEDGVEGVSSVEDFLQKEAVGYKTSEIIEELNISAAAVYNQLKALKDEGKVDVKKLRGKRYWIHTSHVKSE